VASSAPPRRADDLAARYAEDTVRALFPLGGLAKSPSRQETLGLPAREDGSGAWERVRSRVLGAAAAPPVPVPVPVPVPDLGESPVPSTPRAPSRNSGTGTGTGTGTGSAANPGADAPGFFAALRYLGQLDRTYLLCEGDGELVLIDQHAAHERVAFQRLRERSEGEGVPVQRLLFPTTIELPPAEAALAADSGAVLAAVGFDVEPFGHNPLPVNGVPAGLRHEPTAVLRELLDDLAERGGSRALDERLDHVLATIACHSVVRAGDTLGVDEVRALLGQMDGVDFRAHCPHGRPVLLRIGVPEIARRFGRT